MKTTNAPLPSTLGPALAVGALIFLAIASHAHSLASGSPSSKRQNIQHVSLRFDP
ncbi:MAG: hypothetical protein R3F13_10090 [Prosthecobacter sp.]